MRTLETRTRADGIVRRRYLMPDGTKRTTYEVPAAVLSEIGMPRVRAALQRTRRGDQLRRRAAERREYVAQHPEWTASALANDLDISEARVRQIRRELCRTPS